MAHFKNIADILQRMAMPYGPGSNAAYSPSGVFLASVAGEAPGQDFSQLWSDTWKELGEAIAMGLQPLEEIGLETEQVPAPYVEAPRVFTGQIFDWREQAKVFTKPFSVPGYVEGTNVPPGYVEIECTDCGAEWKVLEHEAEQALAQECPCLVKALTNYWHCDCDGVNKICEKCCPF